MTEQWVAGRIIKAVKFDEEVLVMPRTLISCMYFKALMPVSWTDFVSRKLGFQESMNSFQGRHAGK